MRFKARSDKRDLPEINLVPMMDVLMTILVFFIIISMTAEFNQQAVDIQLPSTESGSSDVDQPDPLIVELDQQEQLYLAGQPVDPATMAQQIQQYLAEDPKGVIVLKADYQLSYQQIVEVLGPMREVGGAQVSLAIE
ncbi:biopolymer transporter ExbD [Phormidium sp. FACHB-77]|uniref:ExbD/TolR family protein n=1 Tax=Cyanophyceae TaxID=3028117 RepID=UPI001686A8BC|nr:biopolymer transporter ExbD [Phormidium sp. FACHB-77]MBD1915556.1 biopolymer transporter ExbD [Phormidium sp. FACHB-77]MBD2031866.1 biopolymer transporter ExbD [Phormidium sp. FACHB-322]MBD2050616.1 biopolymer transporter ExbD [Leptolyngbya sp. FACHB-60]